MKSLRFLHLINFRSIGKRGEIEGYNANGTVMNLNEPNETMSLTFLHSKLTSSTDGVTTFSRGMKSADDVKTSIDGLIFEPEIPTQPINDIQIELTPSANDVMETIGATTSTDGVTANSDVSTSTDNATLAPEMTKSETVFQANIERFTSM